MIVDVKNKNANRSRNFDFWPLQEAELYSRVYSLGAGLKSEFKKRLWTREGSITTIPPITITLPCNRFSITIISPCNRHDDDYGYIPSPKLKNDFVTAFTKSK